MPEEQTVVIEKSSIRLRLAEPDDAEFIWTLRTDPYKSRHLHEVGPSVKAQEEWLQRYKERERKGEELYFVAEDLSGKAHGVIRAYDIDMEESRATYGSWIFREDAPGNMAIKANLLLKEYLFNTLGIKSLYTDTRRENKRTVNYLKLFDAPIIDEDSLNYYYCLEQAHYEKGKGKIESLFKLSID